VITVGTVTNKMILFFDNQTNKDYQFTLDISSVTNSNVPFRYYINDLLINTFTTYTRISGMSNLLNFYIPAYSTITIN
jgi:hypothetical protein